MDDEERQHLQVLLRAHLANLRQLEAQAAKYGADVPLSIHNGIADEKRKITDIQTRLGTRAPLSDRASPQHLRRQALSAYFQEQWESAVDLLSQVMATELADDDTQKKLIAARQQLRLQEDYRAVCDLRDAGQWRAVLAAMDDIARRNPSYPDSEGLRQWALNRQKNEMSIAVDQKSRGSPVRSRRSYAMHWFSRIVIPLMAGLFLGAVVFVVFWISRQGDQRTIDIPTAVTPIQPTNAPLYAGLITYTRKDADRTGLYALQPDGTAISLSSTSQYTDVEVLSVSSDRRYLALAASREGALTSSESYPRFKQARSGVSLIIVSRDGQQNPPLFTDEDFLYAAYTAADTEWQLMIAVRRGSIVSYFLAHRDGSELHKVYDSPIVVATATPFPTAPAPIATQISTTQTP